MKAMEKISPVDNRQGDLLQSPLRSFWLCSRSYSLIQKDFDLCRRNEPLNETDVERRKSSMYTTCTPTSTTPCLGNGQSGATCNTKLYQASRASKWLRHLGPRPQSPKIGELVVSPKLSPLWKTTAHHWIYFVLTFSECECYCFLHLQGSLIHGGITIRIGLATRVLSWFCLTMQPWST